MIQVGPDEQIIIRIKKHWMFFFWPLLACVFTCPFIFPVFITVPWLLYRLAYYYIEEIVLTNKKFHIRTGLISRQVISTPLSKINNVSYGQSFFERIVDCGTIYVQSANLMGGSGYSYIRYPDRVKAMIEQAMDAREEGKII
ncbi:MAG: PH domain-containing protein [Selenomonadaceae bacterium]|nr:PH domain-containing protein [Selenomonadaceae bacterium]